MVIVEGSIRSAISARYRAYGWTDYTLGARIAELTAIYQVPIVFANHRNIGEQMTLKFLYHSLVAKLEQLDNE